MKRNDKKNICVKDYHIDAMQNAITSTLEQYLENGADQIVDDIEYVVGLLESLYRLGYKGDARNWRKELRESILEEYTRSEAWYELDMLKEIDFEAA